MEKGKAVNKTGNALSQNESSGSNNSDIQNFAISQISFPQGGGAIKGIEEKFQVNVITDTSTFGIPVPLSPSRHGFVPVIGLRYYSGSRFLGDQYFGYNGNVFGKPMNKYEWTKKL
jgi:hypothetical protein